MFGSAKCLTLAGGILASLLLLPVLVPLVGAASDFDEDGWLVQDWYTRDGRIADGDELGCQGMPGSDLARMPRTTAENCREYLMQRTDASRWASAPLSFGIDMQQNPGFDSADHSVLHEIGFAVHGFDTDHPGTAWHDAADIPETDSDWWNLGYSGSLESAVTPLDEIKTLAEQGGMVNLFWQARIADLKLRTNNELVDWLESEQAWYTTWGEAYSYSYHRSADSVQLERIDDSTYRASNGGSQIGDGIPNRLAWDVPVTRGIDIRNNTVLGVNLTTGPLDQLTLDDRVLRSGWRQQEGILWLSISAGQNVTISVAGDAELDMHPSSCGDLESMDECNMDRRPRFFNNHSWALTIAGFHTTDLFKWSSKFDESPLRFTWLVEPAAVDGFQWGLVVLAGAVGIGTVLYARHLISSDSEAQERVVLESE